jgi:hypothetical protein
MSDELALQQEAVRRIFDLQEKATAEFRAELGERSEVKMKYDEYLLSHLRKGKAFKIALRKANQKFPAEALNPSRDAMEQTEAHYRFFLQMEGLDEKRREVEKHLGLIQQTERKIAEMDQRIGTLLEQMGKVQSAGEPTEGEPPK